MEMSNVESFFLVASLIVTIIILIGWWKIWTKAGYSGWWSLLILIPIVNLLSLLYLAFGHWPIEKQIEEQKNQLHSYKQKNRI